MFVFYIFIIATLDIELDKSENMKDTFDKICTLIKKPRNYGPTPEEKAEMERIAHEERVTTNIHA